MIKKNHPMHEIITLFFNGTGQSNTSETRKSIQIYSLANLLHRQLTHKKTSLLFPGVGTIHPIRGTLFGTGMDAQIQTALEFILPKIKANNHLTLNIFGHSRGAISALLLAKKLSKINPELLSIHLILHDPVPGNYISTSKIDTMKVTLAKQAMDLRHCKNLKKVLTLYTNRPFQGYDPMSLAHAPLFPKYPNYTLVQEEIIPGTHSDAQFSYYYDNQLCFNHPGALIAYLAATKFLIENRTTLHMPSKFYYINAKQQEETEVLRSKIHLGLLKAYRDACTETKQASIKVGHGQAGTVIATYPQGVFFNAQHRMLEGNNNQRVQVRFEHRPNLLEPIYPLLFASLLAASASTLLFSFAHMSLFPSILAGASLMLIYLLPQWLEEPRAAPSKYSN